MSKTKSEMFALIGTNLPDNTSGQIIAGRAPRGNDPTGRLYALRRAGVKEVEVLRARVYCYARRRPQSTHPLQLSFGAAQGSASDPVMINAAGLVTFNIAGNYAVRVKLQCGRTGATGTSILLSRLVLGGAQVGSAACVKLTQTDATTPTDSRVVMNPTAGQTLYVQIMRDSAGSNFGGVYPQIATVTAWGTAPSALLVISRLEPV